MATPSSKDEYNFLAVFVSQKLQVWSHHSLLAGKTEVVTC